MNVDERVQQNVRWQNDLRQTHSLRGGKDGGSRKATWRGYSKKKRKKLGEANKSQRDQED